MIANMLCSFWGTVAFSILFNVHKRFYFCCGLTGMAGWLCYCALAPLGSAPMACFAGTIVVVLLSRIFAVWKKCPITVFLVSGIFPLVPGAGVFWFTYYLISSQFHLSAMTGFTAMKAALAIALGIVFAMELPQRMFSGHRKLH